MKIGYAQVRFTFSNLNIKFSEKFMSAHSLTVNCSLQGEVDVRLFEYEFYVLCDGGGLLGFNFSPVTEREPF